MNFGQGCFLFSCRFAPGPWICSGTGSTGCSFWDEEWVIEDFSGDGSGSMLSITYKYLPECKCSCPNEGIICNTPCHIAESVWIATCSNGQISGTRFIGNTASGSSLGGLVMEHSIVLQYGGSTSHGSR